MAQMGSRAATAATSGAVAKRLCGSSSVVQARYPTTAATDDVASATVILPPYSQATGRRYVLGPAEMTGSILKDAAAKLHAQDHEWEVDLSFTGVGSVEFNEYAPVHYECFEHDPADPPYCALQAIELDGEVESAPAIEASTFDGVPASRRPPLHLLPIIRHRIWRSSSTTMPCRCLL
jgi:preprotein translocase subunit SecD